MSDVLKANALLDMKEDYKNAFEEAAAEENKQQ